MQRELAELNRHFLLLQIEKIENELLPCEKQLEEALEAIRQGKSIADSHFLRHAAHKFSQLRSLQRRLKYTERQIAALPVGWQSACIEVESAVEQFS